MTNQYTRSIFGVNVKIKWVQFFWKIKIPPRHFSMVFTYHQWILLWIGKVISPKRARLTLFESYSLSKYYLILHFKIHFLYYIGQKINEPWSQHILWSIRKLSSLFFVFQKFENWITFTYGVKNFSRRG